MSSIKNVIEEKNRLNKKALSIFLTAGYPKKQSFFKLTYDTIENGADLIEIGIPFSDPLADGPVIQYSSQIALKNGINLRWSLSAIEKIKKKYDTPLILMGYINPILSYGLGQFLKDSDSAGLDGIIIPDVPIDEMDTVFGKQLYNLDYILLTTPSTTEDRIKQIDKKSNGFVYCVSISGTTGSNLNIEKRIIENINRTYKTIQKNKMLIGFGIAEPENVYNLKSYTDGFIVGSAVIDSIYKGDKSFTRTKNLIKTLRYACDN